MLKKLVYLVLCGTYFIVIHGGGRWDEFPEENYFSALVKILPIAALVVFTVSSETVDDVSKRLSRNVTLGLLFSLFGDVCMVWRYDGVLLGMVFFGIAHLFYARALGFNPIGGLGTAVKCILPGFLFFLFLVLPNIADTKLKACGLIYATVIGIMWWRCVVRYKFSKKDATKSACAGAFIFMTSDSIICIDTWVLQLPYASLLIMVTYYTAQFFIATSVTDYKLSVRKGK